jgi:hypothetical protein
MRNDDDGSHSYAPLLRRIAILLVVIAIVPVMLWTITAFMRTYVAQPTIPGARAAAGATTTAPPVSSSDTSASNSLGPTASAVPVPAVVEARATATDARAADNSASRGNRLSDNTAPTITVANAAPAVAAATPASPSASASDVWPAPAATASAPATPAPATPAPATIWPSAAPAQPPALAQQPTETASTPDNTADSLPPSQPLSGPVPLPPRRPTVLALAEASGVPLPRARPAVAPSEPQPPAEELRLGYHGGLGPDHY